MSRTEDELRALEIREQWVSRGLKIGTMYAEAVAKKKALKDDYLSRFPSRGTALEQLETDARYHDAKDDIWQACTELPAIAAMISILDSQLQRYAK